MANLCKTPTQDFPFGYILIGVFLFVGLFCGCQTDPKNKEKAALHLKLGVSFYESGSYPEALSSLLSANELDPENPTIQNNLGLVYFMRERYDLAEKHIRRALDILPSYTDARNNLVRVYIEAKSYKKAQIEMNLVFADLTYGGLERAYANQGLLDFNQQKYPAAEKAFLKAIEYKRDSCFSNNYLGRAIFEQGDYERAARALDRAVSFCQKSMIDEPHYYSALAYFRAKDQARARTRFEEIVRIYINGKYQDKSRQMLDLLGKAD
ncbi:MAG: tetratricopeptide repeat protein [Bdellovibrionaceae bacterium]|nr:tetratricopeptide repeat protein [Pseudobdellovibrionaceae bacterium]